VEVESKKEKRAGVDFTYSAERDRGGHIVAEHLDYAPRTEDDAKVVSHMKERRSRRKKANNPVDKSYNRLIAIPGSPGSGKSTFLARFPTSNAWREFVGTDPIVATLTWNSGMALEPVSLGLRMLYGAVRGMGLEDVTWGQWIEDIGGTDPNATISANDAVAMLRRLFGDRPVLVLVDELAKSANDFDIPIGWSLTNDARVMIELGGLLDNDGDFHAVVSSLQPAYIVDLVSGSQRMVDYVVLTQLFDVNLGGGTDVSDWAKAMHDLIPVAQKTNEFTLNLLSSAALIMSAHPRSVEHLVASCDSNAISAHQWDPLRVALKYPGTFPAVLDALVLSASNISPYFNNTSLDILEHFVLSTEPIRATDTGSRAAQLRGFLEAGAVILFPEDRGDKFLGGVPGFTTILALRKCATVKNPPGPLCTAANQLFDMNKDQLQLPEIFERSVDMTIVARSWSDSPTMFGTGSSLPNALLGTIVPRGASNTQSMLQGPVADGQEEVDVDLQEKKLEKAELKELKGELKELKGERDVAFKASKDTNGTDDKAYYQKQIASAEKQIASAENAIEFQQLLVNAIVTKMTSDVQVIATVCPPELLAQPEDHAADTATVRPHELLVPPKNHPGYDSRVTFPHTNTASLPQGAPEFVFAYIQAKSAAPAKKPADVYASMIYQTLKEHSKDHLSKVKPDDVKSALADVHFIVYNWGDTDGSAPSRKAVMTRLEAMEQSPKSESGVEKEIDMHVRTAMTRLEAMEQSPKSESGVEKEIDMHVRTAMTFVGQYFDSNVQTVAQRRLDTWLIPSLRVFPRLVTATKLNPDEPAADYKTDAEETNR